MNVMLLEVTSPVYFPVSSAMNPNVVGGLVNFQGWSEYCPM